MHLLVTDKRFVVKKSAKLENKMKTCFYYCCFCVGGNCCCPEVRETGDQDEIAFPVNEIKDVKVKSKQQWKQRSSLMGCCPNQFQVETISVDMALVTRYGELVPDMLSGDADDMETAWDNDQDYNKCYKIIHLEGKMDQQEAEKLREVCTALCAQNRGGSNDPEKFAAPKSGPGKSAVPSGGLFKKLMGK